MAYLPSASTSNTITKAYSMFFTYSLIIPASFLVEKDYGRMKQLPIVSGGDE